MAKQDKTKSNKRPAPFRFTPFSGTIGSPTVVAPATSANWPGASKGWQAYGTESPAASSRSASVTDLNNNLLATGTAVSPPQSPTSQWAFQFTGLTPGQLVVLNVKLTFPDQSITALSVFCTVGNA